MLELGMPKGKSDKVTFKPYIQNQIELIPPSADELIPPNHLVRIVNSTIDQLRVEALMARYGGGGASRYHPMMLLKVLIYGYLNNHRSSRMIAKQLRENIHFRWLAGGQSPDFRTINSFRKEKLAPIVDQIFVEVVKLLHESGYVQLKTLYIDGTKMESRANRYTFVWKKLVEKRDAKLEEKVRGFIEEARRITEEENLEFGDEDLPEMGKHPISSEAIQAFAQRVNQVLEKLGEEQTSKDEKKEVKKNSGVSIRRY